MLKNNDSLKYWGTKLHYIKIKGKFLRKTT